MTNADMIVLRQALARPSGDEMKYLKAKYSRPVVDEAVKKLKDAESPSTQPPKGSK